MSRKDELLKLARLFRSQVRLTHDRLAKQTLRKLGDHYQNEAKKLQGQASADCASLTSQNESPTSPQKRGTIISSVKMSAHEPKRTFRSSIQKLTDQQPSS